MTSAAYALENAACPPQTHRVLVVEDEEDNRRIVRDLLTSVGYEIIEAVTGPEGVNTPPPQRRWHQCNGLKVLFRPQVGSKAPPAGAAA